MTASNLFSTFRMWAFALTTVGLISCGGSSSSDSASTSYSFRCDNIPPYDYSSKFTFSLNHSAQSRLGTVVFVHGKTSVPNASGYMSFFQELSTAGYDIRSIQMPWSLNDWDGSSCQGINLIQQKANEYHVEGEKLIVIGHSLGGSHAQIIAAMDNISNIDAVVALAPGHMPHLSAGFQNSVAEQVSSARNLVQNNQGNVIDTYTSPNGEFIATISISATNYLSYHDTLIFADHSKLYPQTRLASLWVGGNSDRLVTSYQYQRYFNLTANPSQKNQYSLVDGDHVGMIANSGPIVISWLETL